MHPTNKNEILAWNLAFDPSELFALPPETVRMRLFNKIADLPEDMARLPLKLIHMNKSPMVIGNLKTLAPEMAKKWGIEYELALKHADTVSKVPDFSIIWGQVFKRPKEAPIDVDEDLYGGFIGNHDRHTLTDLRTMSPQKLSGADPHFDDPWLAELLFRYRARNFPHTFCQKKKASAGKNIAQPAYLTTRPGRVILTIFLRQYYALSENVDARGKKILEELYEYVEMIAPQCD